MLPNGKRDKGTATQVVLYTLWTVLCSLIPALGITGVFYISPVAAVIIGLLGVWFLFAAIKLYRKRDAKTARRLMLTSVSYITLLQIIYVADKFINL